MIFKKIIAIAMCIMTHHTLLPWKLGGRKISTKQTQMKYSFFEDIRNDLETNLKQTKSKKSISTGETDSYIKLATRIEKIYQNLFDKVSQKGSSTKIEPYSLLSFQMQEEMMKELEKIAAELRSELEKPILQTGEITSKLRSMKDKEGKFSVRLKKAQEDISTLKQAPPTEIRGLLNHVNTLYEKISPWANFDSLSITDDNIIKKMTPEQMKLLYKEKKETLEILKNKLAISSSDKNIQQAISELKDKIQASINEAAGKIAGTTKQTFDTHELKQNLQQLSVELSALSSKL